MTTVFTKKFWTVLISAPVIGGIVFACAGGDWPEYGSSSFTPEAFVEKKYSPFFYAPYSYYYGISYDNGQSDRFNEANIADWSGYLGSKATTSELAYLLGGAGKAVVDSINDNLHGKYRLLPPAVEQYELLKDKTDKKVQAFISYLSLAKESAVFANNVSAWWDYEPKKPVQYEQAPALNKALQNGFTSATDKFLKQRYWFQLVRSYFFNGDLEKAVQLFESEKNNFDRNKMYYRTLAYTAGAYYKQKNFSKANYYFSLVYDGCDELKTAAHYSFHPQEESDWNATLALCKNAEEKITLWQMLGVFYKDEKRSIEEIYKLNPSSDKIGLLLARAINKEEQQMNSEYSGFDAAKIADVRINKELLSLVSTIANDSRTNNPFMWNAAAGYLQMLGRNYKQADMYLAKAEKNTINGKLQGWQLRLLKVLNKVAGAVKVDDKLEKDVLADIEWLRSYKVEEGDVFRNADAFSFIKFTMAKKYRKQAEVVKAECYVTRAVFYVDDKNVEAMKTFLQKSGVSDYEKLCRNLYGRSLEDLYDFQGTKFMYSDKVDEAVAAFEKAGEKAATTLQGNPFNGRINDCHECDHESYKGTLYTKVALAKKMKEMKDNVQAGKDVYSNALLLGNAFYNLTYYGNGRTFYGSSIMGSFQYTSNSLDSTFKNTLLSMKVSKAYYQKALVAATTKEQKAKCHYLLAKCERNEWYSANIFDKMDYYYGADMVNLKAISNFKMLQQYADTKYYQEVIKECGYFSTFVKMK